MPVKPARSTKKTKAESKIKAKASASNKTTVIVNVSKKSEKARRAPARLRPEGKIPASPQIISIQNPGNDALLRDIQYQINKLNIQAPTQSLSAQNPVNLSPPPVVSQVEQSLPKIPKAILKQPTGIGKPKTDDVPSTPPPEFQSAFNNDIFQMTPQGDEPMLPIAPAAFRQEQSPQKPGLSYEELMASLEAIPKEKKMNVKTGKIELKPRRGFGETYKELTRQLNRMTKTIRMKKIKSKA